MNDSTGKDSSTVENGKKLYILILFNPNINNL